MLVFDCNDFWVRSINDGSNVIHSNIYNKTVFFDCLVAWYSWKNVILSQAMFRAAGVEPGREGDEMVRQVQLVGSGESLPWLQCSHVVVFLYILVGF